VGIKKDISPNDLVWVGMTAGKKAFLTMLEEDTEYLDIMVFTTRKKIDDYLASDNFPGIKRTQLQWGQVLSVAEREGLNICVDVPPDGVDGIGLRYDMIGMVANANRHLVGLSQN
jgi:hypothetical protein